MSASFRLDGLRVLVTASTRGIGFYVARGLAEWGARVAIVGRSRESVARAAEEISKTARVEPIGISVDLRRREDLERLVEEAWSRLGGLDALVFNAGNIGCEPCYLHEARYEDWLEAAQLHLIAPGYLTSLLLPHFLDQGRGVFIYLSSVTVKEPMSHFVLADTARAGLVQLAKTIARQYGGRGIRANTVLMGSFDTPGARSNIRKLAEMKGMDFEQAWRKWVIELTPMRRVGEPWEIAGLIAFLLSSISSYINGSTIVIDGAMTRCV